MRVWVELVHHLDADAWSERHRAGAVPDGRPFGLEHLADFGVEPVFRPLLEHRASRRAAQVLRDRSGGVEWLEEALTLAASGRGECDAVLCWDEFSGIPAAAASRLPGGLPVVSGVQLLSDPRPGSRTLLALARRTLPRASAVFVQSASMRPALSTRLGLAESDVALVPFGVDEEWFAPGRAGVEPGLVVSVGDDPHRDHDLLLAACAQARRLHPALRLRLSTHLPVLAPPPWCELVPEHLGERRPAWYGAAAVVAVAAHPNLHGSGLSVVLEAMACGRPYVVTASPGLDGYVRHGVDGLVVPPGDEEAFAAAVSDLLGDPARADEMGSAGRHAVEERWNTREQARAVASLLLATAGRSLPAAAGGIAP